MHDAPQLSPRAVALYEMASKLEAVARRCRRVARHEPLGNVIAFLQACTMRSTRFTPSAALFAAYTRYCEAESLPGDKSAATFGLKLRLLGLSSHKSNGVKVWDGLTLTDGPGQIPAPLYMSGDTALGTIPDSGDSEGTVSGDSADLAAMVAAIGRAVERLARHTMTDADLKGESTVPAIFNPPRRKSLNID